MDNDVILITEKDYLRLNSLFNFSNNKELEDLEIELERAKIIPDNEVPPDLVTMNSTVEYFDSHTNKTSTITIVYPQKSDLNQGVVSISAPLGSALIGLRENQEINWQFPSGITKKLKVLKVTYQPEASGDWHL